MPFNLGFYEKCVQVLQKGFAILFQIISTHSTGNGKEFLASKLHIFKCCLSSIDGFSVSRFLEEVEVSASDTTHTVSSPHHRSTPYVKNWQPQSYMVANRARNSSFKLLFASQSSCQETETKIRLNFQNPSRCRMVKFHLTGVNISIFARINVREEFIKFSHLGKSFRINCKL